MEPSKKQTQAAADTAQDPFSQPSKTPHATIVANGMALSGRLCGSGMFWVEGTVEGDIEIAGAVIVTADGVVKGPIRADSVYVAGRVEGSIFARDLLRLDMTGEISGDITAASVLICDGGQLNGCCTMTRADREPVFLY